jgi:hypothetical protein
LRKVDVAPPFYTFSVEVFFVRSHSSGEPTGANSLKMTWCREAVGDMSVTSQGADWSGLLSQISHLVETFIRDYQAIYTASPRSFVIN